jgi:hypothetical protein
VIRSPPPKGRVREGRRARSRAAGSKLQSNW